MNAARQHTDQSQHQGDTTVVLKGTVIRSDSIETSADLAASIYVIQNYGRPEGDQDTLPEGVTAEDVMRAIARHRARRESNRAAIDAHRDALAKPLAPAANITPADQQVDSHEIYTGRAPVWVFVALVLVIGLATWGGCDLCAIAWKAMGGK